MDLIPSPFPRYESCSFSMRSCNLWQGRGDLLCYIVPKSERLSLGKDCNSLWILIKIITNKLLPLIDNQSTEKSHPFLVMILNKSPDQRPAENSYHCKIYKRVVKSLIIDKW